MFEVQVFYDNNPAYHGWASVGGSTELPAAIAIAHTMWAAAQGNIECRVVSEDRDIVWFVGERAGIGDEAQ